MTSFQFERLKLTSVELMFTEKHQYFEEYILGLLVFLTIFTPRANIL
jgi:hypothetical protein